MLSGTHRLVGWGAYLPHSDAVRLYGANSRPRYIASEVTVDLLQSQVAAVCSDPLWIDDTALCTAIADSLDRVEDFLDVYNYPGAKNLIAKTRTVLDAEREPSGSIEGNAYWLLDTNLDQLEENLPDLDLSHVYLCAGGPANTTVSAVRALPRRSPRCPDR